MRTEFALKVAWCAIEFELVSAGCPFPSPTRPDLPRGEVTAAVKRAAAQYRDDGGQGVQIDIGDERNPRTYRRTIWSDWPTLRLVYYEARDLLKEKPRLRDKWDLALAVDLEVHRRRQQGNTSDHIHEEVAAEFRQVLG
jgi:hypothetical protein